MHFQVIFVFVIYGINQLSMALPSPTSDDCEGKSCGVECWNTSGKGLCDGKGSCVDGLLNPCAVHGCAGKKCGDSCLSGDLGGTCNADGECDYESSYVDCGCRNVCHKDGCTGTATNPIPWGVQWDMKKPNNRKGCCFLGLGTCDLCCPSSY